MMENNIISLFKDEDKDKVCFCWSDDDGYWAVINTDYTICERTQGVIGEHVIHCKTIEELRDTVSSISIVWKTLIEGEMNGIRYKITNASAGLYDLCMDDKTKYFSTLKSATSYIVKLAMEARK